MRISLLLQREPFGQIVEQTLARFWSERHGQPYHVQWRMAAPITPDRSVPAAQTWFANIYLNAIFTADAQTAVFDPVRREFSRSTTWWKRPAQQIYTALALGQPSARWLTQARLAVSPPVPDAGNLLIVAGNRKIRLLDRQAGLAFGIQKTGFRPEFMAHELAGRLQARAAGVRTPALLAQSGRGAWYCEQYISGTPINRLANRAAARAAATQAASNLQRLLQATAVERDIGDYVDGLQPLIGKLAAASPLLTTVQREAIEAMTSALVARARQHSGQITLALTHGDFQPANIQALEFADGTFDVVVANHMLYHVPDLAQGLAEVRRVLQPNGRLIASTNGDNHMKELALLVPENVQQTVASWRMRGQGNQLPFRLENGRSLLEPFFAQIDLHLYEDSLWVTEVEPLIAYAFSMIKPEMDVPETAVDYLRQAWAAKIAVDGGIHISKESGVFEAVK